YITPIHSLSLHDAHPFSASRLFWASLARSSYISVRVLCEPRMFFRTSCMSWHPVQAGIRRIPDRIPACTGCHDIQDVLKNILGSHKTLTEMYELCAILAQNNRSAEHTSELQSHEKIVCRLLIQNKEVIDCPRRPTR